MDMISAECVRKRMDELGSRRIPFLFAVNYELSEGFVMENPLQAKDIWWEIDGMTNVPATQPTTKGTFFRRHPISRERYSRMFATAHAGLMRGDSFLLNLTAATPIETDFSAEEIFLRSRARYKLMIPNMLVCFSPETFVTVSNGRISSFPMKGTISADIPNAEQIIRNDYKETAEHCTIVDLIRNDLNRIARNVHVERFRYIDRLTTTNGDLLQVSSEVSGTLPDNWQDIIGTLLFDLLPAGSICGAPKPSTLDIIRRSEEDSRGFYTGVFGYFDGTSLRSAVMIRFIEYRNGQAYFRSGGGITVNSLCENEYQEVLQKVYLPFV